MKTPEEVVQELESAMKGSFGIDLFVGFDHSSLVLDLHSATEVLPDGRVQYERNPEFLSLLKEAMANGGVPIGWYRLKTRETVGDVVELGPLQDQQEEAWVYEYLKHFFDHEDKKGAKYYLVYPDGDLLDITNVE